MIMPYDIRNFVKHMSGNGWSPVQRYAIPELLLIYCQVNLKEHN